MTGPSNPSLYVGVPVKLWETMPADLKSIATRVDSPYTRAGCCRCRQSTMVSREGQAMLASGRAEAVICTDCVVAMSRDA